MKRMIKATRSKIAKKTWLNSSEVKTLLLQQELRVNELAKLIRLVPWTAEEFDTDATVPNQKFATPITILTGGDFSKPAYHFLDGQGDNSDVLPSGVLSVMKMHTKDAFKIEVKPKLARDESFRASVRKLGGTWVTNPANCFMVNSRALEKAFKEINPSE